MSTVSRHNWEIGDRAVDTNPKNGQPNAMRIVDVPEKTAEEYYIDAIGQFVAEVNDCPADDSVIGVAYENDIDRQFDGWRDAVDGEPQNGTETASGANRLAAAATHAETDITVYHYPESRLRAIGEGWGSSAEKSSGQREREQVFGDYSADLAAFERTARKIFENPKTAADGLASAFRLDPAIHEQVANAEAVLDDYLTPGEEEVEPEPGPSPPKSFVRPVRETQTPETRGDCRYTQNDKYRPKDAEAIVCWQCSDKPNNRPRKFRASDTIGTTFNETCEETVITGQETRPRVLSRAVWDSVELDPDTLPQRLGEVYETGDHWKIRGFIERLRSDDEDKIRKAALRVSYEATLPHVEDYNYGRAAALLRDCGVDTDALFPGGDSR